MGLAGYIIFGGVLLLAVWQLGVARGKSQGRKEKSIVIELAEVEEAYLNGLLGFIVDQTNLDQLEQTRELVAVYGEQLHQEGRAKHKLVNDSVLAQIDELLKHGSDNQHHNASGY